MLILANIVACSAAHEFSPEQVTVSVKEIHLHLRASLYDCEHVLLDHNLLQSTKCLHALPLRR